VGLFDDFTRAFSGGGFSPESFSGPGYQSVWSQLKPWLQTISTNGVLKWIPRASSQMPCQIPVLENGIPVGPCPNVALETCLACGKAVCLAHSFVNDNGDAICYGCVGKLQHAGAQYHARQHHAPPPPPPPQDPQARARTTAKQQAWWAYTVLNVQEGVPWESIKKQHRALSAQHHPDRPGGDEARFKDVQKAYDILKLVYGEN